MQNMRDPANWSDPPTADQVARAIVAASRAVGADPLDVANGVIHTAPPARTVAIGRARSYAAKALAKAFTSYPRTRIAGMVGCKGLVRQSYFSALDQRLRFGRVEWWDDAVLAAVVDAVASGDMSKIPPNKVVEKIDMALMSAESRRKVGEYLNVPIYKVPSIPPAKPVKIEENDDPVFDRGALGGVKPRAAPPRLRQLSKAEMQADLEAALRRTAEMQKPEE